MKTFVTGTNGFVGSHLIDLLLSQGIETHALIRKTSNLRWLKDKKIQYHYGDITEDLDGLKKGLKNADVVFHIAGVIRAHRVKTYFDVNVQGTKNVLDACLAINPNVKRVVIVTSLAAHGPSPEGYLAKEEDECRPITAYGQSKMEAEKVAQQYMDKLPVTIVRPPAIYGPRDEQILPFFRMASWGIVLIPGVGKRLLNLAYVEDVVIGMMLAAEHPRAIGETFFIGEDRNYDWEEVAATMGQAIGRSRLVRLSIPQPLVYGAAGLAEVASFFTGKLFPLNLAYARNFLQKNWAMDISKAKQLLGFQPRYSLIQGVKETSKWYKKEKWY